MTGIPTPVNARQSRYSPSQQTDPGYRAMDERRAIKALLHP